MVLRLLGRRCITLKRNSTTNGVKGIEDLILLLRVTQIHGKGWRIIRTCIEMCTGVYFTCNNIASKCIAVTRPKSKPQQMLVLNRPWILALRRTHEGYEGTYLVGR